MGTSKVVFIGAIAIVTGMYAVGIKKADHSAQSIAEFRASRAQAEEIAKTGFHLAANKKLTDSSNPWPSVTGMQILGGELDYTVVNDGDKRSRVTSVGRYNGHEATCVVIIKEGSGKKKKSGRYELLRFSITSDQLDISSGGI